MKEQPNGRDAQGAFIPSTHAPLSQHINVLTNLEAPESHCSRVFIKNLQPQRSRVGLTVPPVLARAARLSDLNYRNVFFHSSRG